MNLSAGLIALVPALVTVMSTIAASAVDGTIPAPLRTDEVEAGTVPEKAGLTAVIWVSEFTVTDAAAVEPKVTVVELPHEKPLPRMLTAVPPADGPEFGETDVIAGAAGHAA